MVLRLIPLNDAYEVAADLQVWAVNVPVSIPLSDNVSFIHLAMVSDDAALYGLVVVIIKAQSDDLLSLIFK